ncbi:hypothetical protein ERX46_03140 [Brumimicrobium glaciale]|jgi:hypothetical protein|uniref:Uncharacterized protein n=1 Tax=Brumimicrobium glaciale TaxID=200475 RepID=A0A4Q4KR33_9FLAO|nr:hypothetical protein [Brumimicrobium glaciale]RYM36006.1 hypothetical protein ERX46_03140 [Brumimicrobium glaciale]
MKKLIFISLLIFSITSCKKCDPTNAIGGIVIEDAIVRVIGYEEGENFITESTDFDKLIEVSFDGGINYKPVDFSKYSVMSLQTTASCSSGYYRAVVANKSQQTVNYTVTITECPTCQNTSTINNWVLTKIVPNFYVESYNIVRQ